MKTAIIATLFVLMMCVAVFCADRSKVIEITYECGNEVATIRGDAKHLTEFFETYLTNYKTEWKLNSDDRFYHARSVMQINNWHLTRIPIATTSSRNAFEKAMNDWHVAEGKRVWVTNPTPILRKR